jgi:hypothetical protein
VYPYKADLPIQILSNRLAGITDAKSRRMARGLESAVLWVFARRADQADKPGIRRWMKNFQKICRPTIRIEVWCVLSHRSDSAGE